jgi:hypothetical protein
MENGENSMQQSEHKENQGPDDSPSHNIGVVEVIVDRVKKKVKPGPYRVSVFKHEVGVAAEKELDQIIKGSIKPLDDNETIVIAGGEVFISHERTGAAS